MATDDDIGLDRPSDWAEAVAALAGRRRRVLLAGPTDVGKSSFARALIAAWPAGSPPPALIDADPGQKMVGPPGTVTLSAPGSLSLEALRFVGTTSAAAVGAIVDAVAELADRATGHALIVNSSGMIRGPGAALLTGMVGSAQVDEIVAIGWPPELEPLLDRTGVPVRRLVRPPGARRKGKGERARSRREALSAHLADGRVHTWPRAAVSVPLPTICLALPAARPVCAVAGADGTDQSLGILIALDERDIQVFAPPPAAGTASLRLGAMWARPGPTGWELLDQLLPASDAVGGRAGTGSSF